MVNTHSAPEDYQALALQLSCQAINQAGSVADCRARMQASLSDVRAKLLGARGFIQSFTGLPLKLVVLPEYFLTGFPMGEPVADWSAKAAFDPAGPEYETLGSIAQQAGVFLSGNAYETDSHFPELYFQTSFIIDPSGDVILRYRRLVSMYAPTPHDVLDKYLDVYGADSLFPVADTDIGRLACVASEEILYPEITRALALKGAEVICHSSSEVGSPLATPKNIAKRARAYENLVYVVSANSAGIDQIPFPAQSTDGHSQLVDFHGAVVAEAGPGESMVGNGEISIAHLRETRRRPAMTNCLARQRLELFAPVYAGQPVYPANNLLSQGKVQTPARSHFLNTIDSSIQALAERGII